MLRNQKQHGICEKKDIQEKDGYKFALLSDRELEWFDTHKCQTGKTQCANSRRLLVLFLFLFFFWHYAIYPLDMPFEEMLLKTRNACENTASDHPHSRVCNR